MSEPHWIRVAEFALSEEEGRAVYEKDARPALAAEQRIALDFSGCHVLCTHWLSGFYSPLFDSGTVAEVHRQVREVGASASNRQAIDMMYQAAQAHEDQETWEYHVRQDDQEARYERGERS